MSEHPVVISRSRLRFILAFALLPSVSFAGTSEKVLHAFRGGMDGTGPTTGLTMDSSQIMYGTTSFGGDKNCPPGRGQGCGLIFQIDRHGTEKMLHTFAGGDNDGAFPSSELIADGAGNYYGVTEGGGPNDVGTLFKLASDATVSIVYAFQGGSDGSTPIGGLARDSSGNLYGTTYYGGSVEPCGNPGCGTVFKVAPDGAETILHAFQGGADGEAPEGGLIVDSIGNLYGTTELGGNGCASPGCGTAFKIAPDGTETILHTFLLNGTDGALPGSGLIIDEAGSLYGTTSVGGTSCQRDGGCGTVFEISSDGTESVLHSFHGGNDGSRPAAGVVMDSAGNLYGTTYFGGDGGCKRSQGCGTVFELTPGGKESVLFAFKKGSDGYRPMAPLLLAGKKLYGTAVLGGKGNKGVVFELKK